MKTNNQITDHIGTPFDLCEQISQLNSDLHISRVSIFIENLNNTLKDLKNDELFPILEFNPYHYGEDDDRITDINFFIYFRGLNNETPPHSFTIKSNTHVSFILKLYNSLELSTSLIEFLDTDKKHSAFSLNLDYDENTNREKIMESLLNTEQLLKCRAIILDSNLKVNKDLGTKTKRKI